MPELTPLEKRIRERYTAISVADLSYPEPYKIYVVQVLIAHMWLTVQQYDTRAEAETKRDHVARALAKIVEAER